MKVVILYRPQSEYSRVVETFSHDFGSRYPQIKLELMNIDGREAIAMASLYDIMNFPAVLALTIDGQLLQVWQGGQLPLLDEVAAYVRQ